MSIADSRDRCRSSCREIARIARYSEDVVSQQRAFANRTFVVASLPAFVSRDTEERRAGSEPNGREREETRGFVCFARSADPAR